jgi:hypothetical protein
MAAAASSTATPYIFDRIALVILPKGLGKGDLTGLMKDYIDIYDRADTALSFRPTMTFGDTAFRDRQVIFTEKSSTVISREVGKVGTRDREKIVMRKTYQLDRPNHDAGNDRIKADIVMNCIYYELTAP